MRNKLLLSLYVCFKVLLRQLPFQGMFLLPLSLLYEEPPKDVEMIYYVSQKENFVIKYPESNWEKVSFVSNGSTAKYVHVDADFNLAVFNPKMLKPGDLKKWSVTRSLTLNSWLLLQK